VALGAKDESLLVEPDRRAVAVPRLRTRLHAGAEPIPPDQIDGWEWVDQKLKDRPLVAIEIVGTCMEPDYPEGIVVIADREAKWEPGVAVAAVVDGLTVCKWLEGSPDAWRLEDNLGEVSMLTEATQILGIVIRRTDDAPRRRPRRNGG
jgi:hypothetical protein